MMKLREVSMVLGVVLAVTPRPAVSAADPPRPGRNLTAEERKEVQRLTAEMNGHIEAERFEETVQSVKRIVAYRAERQGERYWQVIDARLQVERWQRLTAVPPGDRAAVV